MIKLSATLGKKTPIPGMDFSSRQCGAGMEVEVSDTADPREVAETLRRLYGTLERAVDAQLADPPGGHAPARLPARQEGFGGSGNGGRAGKASPAQVKAVHAISRDRGMTRDELVQALRAEYGVERPDDLGGREASDLIGTLQRMERIRR